MTGDVGCLKGLPVHICWAFQVKSSVCTRLLASASDAAMDRRSQYAELQGDLRQVCLSICLFLLSKVVFAACWSFSLRLVVTFQCVRVALLLCWCCKGGLDVGLWSRECLLPALWTVFYQTRWGFRVHRVPLQQCDPAGKGGTSLLIAFCASMHACIA